MWWNTESRLLPNRRQAFTRFVQSLKPFGKGEAHNAFTVPFPVPGVEVNPGHGSHTHIRRQPASEAVRVPTRLRRGNGSVIGHRIV